LATTIGGGNTEYISQSFTVPVDKPYLSFWEAHTGACSFCLGLNVLVTVNGKVVVEINTHFGSTSWYEYVVDLNSYAVRKITVVFTLSGNQREGGWIEIDDVVFKASE
jgi:hypothetical protein